MTRHDRLAMWLGLLDDLDDDHLARLGAVALVGRDDQVLVDAAVLRHRRTRRRVPRGAARRLRGWRAAARRRSRLPGARGGRRRVLRAGAVAVQHLVHLARRQEQVIAARVGNQEAEAVRVALDRPGHEVELGGDAELALAVDQDLAVALEDGDAVVKGAALLLSDAKARCDFGGAQRHTGIGKLVQDRLRRDRRAAVGGGIPRGLSAGAGRSPADRDAL